MRYLLVLLLLSGCGSTTIMLDEKLTTSELQKRNLKLLKKPQSPESLTSVSRIRSYEPKEKGTVLTPFPE